MAARKTGISATPDGHNAVADRAIDILLSFNDKPKLDTPKLSTVPLPWPGSGS